MVLKCLIPSVHAVDLEGVVSLTRALGQVALGPLAVTGGKLLDADGRVGAIVAIKIEVIRSSFSSRTTVWKLVGVVMATSLLTTFKVALHTFGIVGELVNPSLLGRQEGEPIVHDLLGELGQAGQSLQRVSRRDLLVLGGGDGENDG